MVIRNDSQDEPGQADPGPTLDPIGSLLRRSRTGPETWHESRLVDLIDAPTWIILLHRMARLGYYDHRAGVSGRVLKFTAISGLKANYPALEDVDEVWFVYRDRGGPDGS